MRGRPLPVMYERGRKEKGGRYRCRAREGDRVCVWRGDRKREKTDSKTG